MHGAGLPALLFPVIMIAGHSDLEQHDAVRTLRAHTLVSFGG